MATLVKDMERLPCHDCGCEVGEHHIPGCDMERCPKCKGQLISCGCFVVNDEFDENEFSKYTPEVWSGIAYEEALLYAEKMGWWDGGMHDINRAMAVIINNSESL